MIASDYSGPLLSGCFSLPTPTAAPHLSHLPTLTPSLFIHSLAASHSMHYMPMAFSSVDGGDDHTPPFLFFLFLFFPFFFHFFTGKGKMTSCLAKSCEHVFEFPRLAGPIPSSHNPNTSFPPVHRYSSIPFLINPSMIQLSTYPYSLPSNKSPPFSLGSHPISHTRRTCSDSSV